MKPFKNDRREAKKENLITASRVVIIDADGKNLGEFLTQDALLMAQERDLELVPVGGDSAKPICKIMDLGKWNYQKKKRQQKKSDAVKVKEIKLRPVTELNDIITKSKQAKEFLLDGERVKVSVVFKGREVKHLDIARDRCDDFYKQVSDIAEIDGRIMVEGKSMIMNLVKRG